MVRRILSKGSAEWLHFQLDHARKPVCSILLTSFLSSAVILSQPTTVNIAAPPPRCAASRQNSAPHCALDRSAARRIDLYAICCECCDWETLYSLHCGQQAYLNTINRSHGTGTSHDLKPVFIHAISRTFIAMFLELARPEWTAPPPRIILQ